MLADWVMSTFEELVSQAPFGNGRVQLGFAFDGWFLPKEVFLPVVEKVKGLGVEIITTHYVRNAIHRQYLRFAGHKLKV
jgi:hypothetical protein